VIDRLLVLCLAYILALFQVGVLGNWPLFGGQPLLAALLAGLFLVIDRPVDGIWWVVASGYFLDLLSPSPAGFILVPFILGYFLLVVIFPRLPDAVPLLRTVLAAFIVLCCAELPLAIWSGAWEQFARDMISGVMIALPLAVTIDKSMQPFVRGLRIFQRQRKRRRGVGL